MMRHRYDFDNNYLTAFDDLTGEYFRSGIIDPDGNDTGEEPFMGDFPHLLDIGIKGFCEHGLSGKCLESGTYCYQRGGDVTAEDMSLENYRRLMEECEGKVFQVALGGRGDADCHPHYQAILETTRAHGIVPNMTTSGYLFDRDKAKITSRYCGAGAVSWYKSPYTNKAIDLMLEEGVTTNIHYILSEKSIGEAVHLMETDGFPKGIRAVIFLLYKPVGYDRQDLVLRADNPYIRPFFDHMNADDQPYMMGFDSCLAPGVLTMCKDVAPQCIEPCESGRFSAYISSDMTMYPCSFIQKPDYAGNLMTATIKEIWSSHGFDKFRSIQRNACRGCSDRSLCLGGCPEMKEINLCTNREREMHL